MKIGFAVPNLGALANAEGMIQVAQQADRLGFETLWITDHVIVPRESSSRYPYNESGRLPVDPDGNYFEPLASLAYLGGLTQRIRLGTSVLIAPYRNPVVTAKMLSSLDALSGGRVTVGIGTGWLREEFEALQTPPFEQRGAVTDECIQLFKLLWTEQNPVFEGKFFQVRNIGFNPKPVQKPHPPLLIGGDAPAALRRVARHGDGWQPLGYSVEALREQLDRLRRICQEEGRRYEDLTISARIGVRLADRPNAERQPGEDPRQVVVGTPAEIVELGKRLQDLGVDELGFHYRSTPDLGQTLLTMERIARDIAPALA